MSQGATSAQGGRAPAACAAWLPWAVLIAGLGLAVAGLFLLTRAAAGVPEPLILALDDTVLGLAQGVRTPGLTRVMAAVSTMGGWPALIGVLFAATAARLARHDRRGALLTMAVLGGGGVLTLALKEVFRRARPPAPLTPAAGYAFPSGHALLSLCLYGFLAYRALRAGWPLLLRLAVAGGCAGLSLAVSLSRIYLGVHWPTDVVAGLAAGAMWLAACIAADRVLECQAAALGARRPSRPAPP